MPRQSKIMSSSRSVPRRRVQPPNPAPADLSAPPEAPAQPETNPARVYLSALAPTGRRSMESALCRVAERAGGFTLDSMPWSRLRYEHLAALRAELAQSLAPATVNKYLAAVRGVLRAAWQMGQIDAETYHRAVAVGSVPGSSLPTGRALPPEELRALLVACAEDPTPAGARDAALIALAYAGGLRRSELAALDLEHVTEGEPVTVRLTRAKRHKERMVYLSDGAAQALTDWLAVRGRAPGPLFYSGVKGGHLIPGQRFTGSAIRAMLDRRATVAGLPALTPHDLRRSFVSDLLDAGVDIATVAAMAGHESVRTTQRYDRRGEAAQRRAAQALQVPYERPETQKKAR